MPGVPGVTVVLPGWFTSNLGGRTSRRKAVLIKLSRAPFKALSQSWEWNRAVRGSRQKRVEWGRPGLKSGGQRSLRLLRVRGSGVDRLESERRPQMLTFV